MASEKHSTISSVNTTMLDLLPKADDDNNTLVFIIVGGTIGGILLGTYIAQ